MGVNSVSRVLHGFSRFIPAGFDRVAPGLHLERKASDSDQHIFEPPFQHLSRVLFEKGPLPRAQRIDLYDHRLLRQLIHTAFQFDRIYSSKGRHLVRFAISFRADIRHRSH